MKKIVALAVIGMCLAFSATGASADQGGASSEGQEMGQKMSGFLQKLNPVPFFREQERRYNERKASAAK